MTPDQLHRHGKKIYCVADQDTMYWLIEHEGKEWTLVNKIMQCYPDCESIFEGNKMPDIKVAKNFSFFITGENGDYYSPDIGFSVYNNGKISADFSCGHEGGSGDVSLRQLELFKTVVDQLITFARK